MIGGMSLINERKVAGKYMTVDILKINDFLKNSKGHWGHLQSLIPSNAHNTTTTTTTTMASSFLFWPRLGKSQSSPSPQSKQDTGSNMGNDLLLEPYSTLEEPVLETIMRDVRAVHAKLKVVMLPLDRSFAPLGYTGVEQESNQEDEEEVLGENQRKVIESLKDWDLWYVENTKIYMYVTVLTIIYYYILFVGAHCLCV